MILVCCDTIANITGKSKHTIRLSPKVVKVAKRKSAQYDLINTLRAFYGNEWALKLLSGGNVMYEDVLALSKACDLYKSEMYYGGLHSAGSIDKNRLRVVDTVETVVKSIEDGMIEPSDAKKIYEALKSKFSNNDKKVRDGKKGSDKVLSGGFDKEDMKVYKIQSTDPEDKNSNHVVLKIGDYYYDEYKVWDGAGGTYEDVAPLGSSPNTPGGGGGDNPPLPVVDGTKNETSAMLISH